VAWIVYSLVIYTIVRECFFYISLRQAFLLTPQYAERISSRTVLFTSVPGEYLDKGRLHDLFNGSVRNVWIPGDTKELDKIVQERDNVAMKLEKGEVEWIRLCNKERIRHAKKIGTEVEKEAAATSDPESGGLGTSWIPDDKRPTHRTGPLGLIGKKVDTIQWGREKLKALIPATQNAQANWLAGEYKKHSAVFLMFATQHDAQLAFQTANHHRALQLSPRFIGIKPKEVIWQSLNYSWWQTAILRYATYATITGLIVFWAVPVTIVGFVAQVNMIKTLPGFTWMQDIPQASWDVRLALFRCANSSVRLFLVSSLVCCLQLHYLFWCHRCRRSSVSAPDGLDIFHYRKLNSSLRMRTSFFKSSKYFWSRRSPTALFRLSLQFFRIPARSLACFHLQSLTPPTSTFPFSLFKVSRLPPT
jgi:hypothetical protein